MRPKARLRGPRGPRPPRTAGPALERIRKGAFRSPGTGGSGPGGSGPGGSGRQRAALLPSAQAPPPLPPPGRAACAPPAPSRSGVLHPSPQPQGQPWRRAQQCRGRGQGSDRSLGPRSGDWLLLCEVPTPGEGGTGRHHVPPVLPTQGGFGESTAPPLKAGVTYAEPVPLRPAGASLPGQV